VSNSAAAHLKKKRVLLVDAVAWSPLYPPDSPNRNVGRWFSRWLEDLPGLSFQVANTEADLARLAEHEADGVILSGSPRDAWGDDPVNEQLCSLALRCAELGKPFLGVCYGHQILGRALGGKVARHPQGWEVGNTPVELTEAGRRSPLFAGLPQQISVLSSHADAVLDLPAGCDHTVRGGFTPIQGLEWKGLLFGVQFHPETDPDTLRFLWSVRRDAWRGRVSFNLDRQLDEMTPTPQAAQILTNFVSQIIP
jgi:GMP synthase (glutamine-hydrolysing)